jgi:hypothetical protein
VQVIIPLLLTLRPGPEGGGMRLWEEDRGPSSMELHAGDQRAKAVPAGMKPVSPFHWHKRSECPAPRS